MKTCRLVLSLFFVVTGTCFAATYQINWQIMNMGGGLRASGNHKMVDSFGWQAVGKSQSANFALQSGFIKTGIPEMVITPAGGTFTLHGTELVIPAGAVNTPTRIEITAPAVASVPRLVYDPNLRGANIVREIKVADGTTRFNKEITMRISFTEADVAGMDRNNLKIAFYDRTKRSWQVIMDSKKSGPGNKVVANVKHTGIFRIVEWRTPTEIVENLSNYPNPFIAGLGRTTRIRYSLRANSEVKLMIFDLAGTLVWQREISAGDPRGGVAGPNEIEWDGKNENGNYVTVGGYICLVRVGDKVIRTKIGVK